MPIEGCEFSEARAENLLAEAFRQAGWRVGEDPDLNWTSSYLTMTSCMQSK